MEERAIGRKREKMEEREKFVFVLGFCFSSDNKVVLIRKKKDDWQAGKLNGIGGRVEPGETFCEAMEREFREETGRTATADCWQYILTMSTNRVDVHVFRTLLDFDIDFHDMREGTVSKYDIGSLADEERVSGLEWLIPLCNDGSVVPGVVGKSTIYQVY